VITVYAGAAFVILELVDIIAEPFNLPSWLLLVVIVLLSIGFIIAIILSWIYDIHPEGGMVKTEPAEKVKAEEIPKSSNGWKIASYISFVVIVSLIFLNVFNGKGNSRINESLEKSIAVLPFLNLSGDNGQDYICEGLTGEIINNLLKIESLNRVPSLTSVLNYKNSQKDISEMASELQVNYILECQYKKLSGQLRFSTLLIEAKSGNHLWQHDFDRQLTELSAIPSDIALEIAEQLKAIITNPEKENIRRVHTTIPEAYELYHQANFFSREVRDQEGLISCIALLQETIRLDPEYALAYTSLANAYLKQYWFKFDQSKELLVLAKEAIEKSLDIDSELPEAYIQLANYYYTGFLDYNKALIQLNKASELLPDYSQLNFLTAVIYRRMGRWDESTFYFKKALSEDPSSIIILGNLSETYYCMGRYQEALELCETIKTINPGSVVSYENEIFIYLLRDGNTKQAKEVLNEAARIHLEEEVLKHSLYLNPLSIYIYDKEFQKALDFLETENWEGEFSILYYYPKNLLKGWIYDQLDRPIDAFSCYNSARQVLDSLLTLYPDDSRYNGAMGVVCAGLGDKENAIGYAKKAVKLRNLNIDAFFGLTRIEELAWVYVLVGKYEAAMEQIEILLANPGPYSAPLLNLDPKWKPLWDHPDFKRLTEKYSIKGS
jgi:serine/threonine-protein kinase